MELTSEQIVTNLLSKKEIINKKRKFLFNPSCEYNLGNYIASCPIEKSPYEGKYVFIR